MRRYYLHTRKRGVYYAELIDQTTGKKLTARSTGKTDRDDAVFVVSEWLRTGIPTGRMHRLRPAAVAFGLDAILSSIRKTDLDPEDALQIVRALRDRGLIDVQAVPAGAGAEDFASFLESFWNHDSSPYVREKLAHGQSIGKRHCLESLNRVRCHYREAFTGRTLASITRADLKAFALALSSKGLAAGSINKLLIVTSTALSWAHREGLIPADPSEGLRRFSGESAKRGILTPEEAAAVFRVQWQDDRARAGNLLAATTGLRSGEVLAVRRSDIGEAVLHVRHSWSSVDGLKSPKNGEARRVPLLPEVRRELLALLEQTPHDVPDPFVFFGLLPDKPMDNKFLIDGLKEACTAAGIDATSRGIVFHSWRHYYAARMADRMTADQVSRVTGHKSRAVFDSYANHVTEKNLAEVGAVGAEVFGNIVEFRREA